MGERRSRKFPAYPIVTGIAALLVVTLVFRMTMPLSFHYLCSYVSLISRMVAEDDARHVTAKVLAAETEWRLHQMEMLYNEQWCAKQRHKKGRFAWLTAMNNDNFAIGAVAMGYLIQKLSCHKEMIALVSKDVSNSSKIALAKVGYDVRVVAALDCNWMDVQKGRKPKDAGIPGTHMRFHAWNYTEYDAIMYVDADVMPLVSIDELFELEGEFAAAYCGRPGVVDPCFNAGLLMFRPSYKSYIDIMTMWSDLSNSSCPNDQVLLWHYYADAGRWTPLPYAYNVRREIYHPMKAYHFACCLTPKPWRVKKIPSREEADGLHGPIQEATTMVLLWWKHFYVALDNYHLHDWWQFAQQIR